MAFINPRPTNLTTVAETVNKNYKNAKLFLIYEQGICMHVNSHSDTCTYLIM